MRCAGSSANGHRISFLSMRVNKVLSSEQEYQEHTAVELTDNGHSFARNEPLYFWFLVGVELVLVSGPAAGPCFFTSWFSQNTEKPTGQQAG